MVCPKCRFEQADAAECTRCGVVVARHRTRPGAAPLAVVGPPAEVADAGSGGWSTRVRRLAPVLVLGALSVWAYRTTFPATPAAAPAPAVQQRPDLDPVPVFAAATLAPEPEPQPEPAGAAAEVYTEPAAPPPPEAFPTATCPLAVHAAGGARRVSSTWYTAANFTQATDEQAAASAPMVIYVYTDWCPYCREFERELLTTRAVDTYLRDNVVKVRVNPETNATEQALANELGVRGFPSFFVMTPGGQPEKMGLRVNGRLRSPADFIADIDSRMKQQAGAHVADGLRLQQQGQVAEAMAALSAAIRLRPDDDGPYRVTHEMLGREKRWDEVVACWTSFLESHPSQGGAYLARADALARRGTPGLGRADIRKACELGERQAC